MGEKTAIEWADKTFNPWIGCQKVGPGCDNCYAEKERATTILGVKWGAHEERHRTGADNWRQPRKLDREAAPAACSTACSMTVIRMSRRDLQNP